MHKRLTRTLNYDVKRLHQWWEQKTVVLCVCEHALPLLPSCVSAFREIKAFYHVPGCVPGSPQDPNQSGRLLGVPIYHFTGGRTPQIPRSKEKAKRGHVSCNTAIIISPWPWSGKRRKGGGAQLQKSEISIVACCIHCKRRWGGTSLGTSTASSIPQNHLVQLNAMQSGGQCPKSPLLTCTEDVSEHSWLPARVARAEQPNRRASCPAGVTLALCAPAHQRYLLLHVT